MSNCPHRCAGRKKHSRIFLEPPKKRIYNSVVQPSCPEILVLGFKGHLFSTGEGRFEGRRFSKVRQCRPFLIKDSVGSFVTDNCGVNLTLRLAAEEKLFTSTGGTFLAGMGCAGFFSCLDFSVFLGISGSRLLFQ